jgi:hypothetical protein
MAGHVDHAFGGSQRLRVALTVQGGRSMIDTPALVIDADRLRANIEAMAAVRGRAASRCARTPRRTKMVEVAALQLEAGAAGLTVAKLGEAEVFADGGCDDLLIAYPLVGEAKLERLAALARRARVAVALDSLEVARDRGVRARTSPCGSRPTPGSTAGVAPAGVAGLARARSRGRAAGRGRDDARGPRLRGEDLAAATRDARRRCARRRRRCMSPSSRSAPRPPPASPPASRA